MRKLTLKLDVAGAKKLIDDYCIDEPSPGALQRLLRAELIVSENPSGVAIPTDSGTIYAEQQQIDELLYV